MQKVFWYIISNTIVNVKTGELIGFGVFFVGRSGDERVGDEHEYGVWLAGIFVIGIETGMRCI